MKRRGFTLIELLAVIVILAIIALIATPIVMNVIENSKKGAAERTVENIEKAAELYYYNKKINGEFSRMTFVCDEEGCKSGEELLELNGKVPENGLITINQDGTIVFNSIVINGYSCYKDGESCKCDKAEKTSKSTTNGLLTLNGSKTTILSNYLIKGNSVQQTRSGKNLFDISKVTGGIGTDYSSLRNGYITIDSNKVITSHIGAYGMGAFLNGSKMRLEKGTYTISADFMSDKDSGNKEITLGIRDLTNQQTYNTYTKLSKYQTWERKEYTFTIESDVDIAIGVQSVGQKDDYTNLKLKIKNIQLEKSNKATEYELYGVSPSPKYPSEIQSVGDLVTEEGPNKGKYEIPIKVTGKNLFALDQNLINGGILGGNTVTSNSTSTDIDVYLKKGTYSIMFNRSNNGGVFLRKGQVSNGYFSQISSGDVAKFTFTEDGYLRISYFGNGGKISDIMLVEGSYTKDTMPSFEPYTEKTYSIYLDDPLRCLGNVCDYIDYTNQKVVRYIKVIDNTGTKTIEESFEVLLTPEEKTLSLPDIGINKGVSNITIDTNIKSSEFIVDYYN